MAELSKEAVDALAMEMEFQIRNAAGDYALGKRSNRTEEVEAQATRILGFSEILGTLHWSKFEGSEAGVTASVQFSDEATALLAEHGQVLAEDVAEDDRGANLPNPAEVSKSVYLQHVLDRVAPAVAA